jgi:hypothetical protein
LSTVPLAFAISIPYLIFKEENMQLYQTKKGSTRIKLDTGEKEILDALDIIITGGRLDARSRFIPGHWIPLVIEPHMVKHTNMVVDLLMTLQDVHLKMDVEWRQYDYLVTMSRPGEVLSFISISVFSIDKSYLEAEWHRQIHSLPGRIAPEREPPTPTHRIGRPKPPSTS